MVNENPLGCQKFQKPLRRSRRQSAFYRRQQKVINLESLVITLALLVAAGSGYSKRPLVEALHISNFRVPSYVPVNLASNPSGELAKPLLFDCDYDYEPNEDSRLTVKWFRNKEAEPFYQWLPELNVRHLADWIRPLVNQSFVSDPTDPLKRYRSLLVKRLSLNLTGQYTCLVSSLAGQDYRMGSLVIYQPPRAFTFEHRVLPREQASSPAPDLQQDGSGWRAAGGRPTQFKVFTQPALIVRPANNDNQAAGQSANNGSSPSSGQRLVYTHDGRPVRKPIGKSKRQAADWMLRQRLAGSTLASHSATSDSSHALQLHHLQCSASQVTPRPTLVLTVKRDADSIAQYLHESSSLSIRPYQVGWQDYLQDLAKLRAKGELEGSLISKSGEFAASNASQPTVTLYDITVSATVALNVSLSSAPSGPSLSQVSSPSVAHLHAAGINTVLAFRRGQRMSFECQLEITGTEFEQRRRININEDEVFQFAELEEKRRRLKLQQDIQAFERQGPPAPATPGSSFNLLAPSLSPSQSSSSATLPIRSRQLQTTLLLAALLSVWLGQLSKPT